MMSSLPFVVDQRGANSCPEMSINFAILSLLPDLVAEFSTVFTTPSRSVTVTRAAIVRNPSSKMAVNPIASAVRVTPDTAVPAVRVMTPAAALSAIS